MTVAGWVPPASSCSSPERARPWMGWTGTVPHVSSHISIFPRFSLAFWEQPLSPGQAGSLQVPRRSSGDIPNPCFCSWCLSRFQNLVWFKRDFHSKRIFCRAPKISLGGLQLSTMDLEGKQLKNSTNSLTPSSAVHPGAFQGRESWAHRVYPWECDWAKRQPRLTCPFYASPSANLGRAFQIFKQHLMDVVGK